MPPLSLRLLLLLPLLAVAPLSHASSEDEESEDESSVVDDTEDTETAILNARKMLTLEWKDHLRGAGTTRMRLDPDDPTFLSIESTTQNGGTLKLIQFTPPPLDTPFYALRMEIQYRAVSGTAHLDLVSRFPDDKGEHHSRTLAEYGPMKRIEGRSRLRTVWIPFDASALEAQPEELTLNLVMASVGKLEIGPIELYEFADAKSMWAIAKSGERVEKIRSLSDPQRRVKMALALLGITAAVGGIHFWHLRSSKTQSK